MTARTEPNVWMGSTLTPATALTASQGIVAIKLRAAALSATPIQRVLTTEELSLRLKTVTPVSTGPIPTPNVSEMWSISCLRTTTISAVTIHPVEKTGLGVIQTWKALSGATAAWVIPLMFALMHLT
ncbi:uncharacterized protein [Diadema antillarum]|uniref:uncharacterized protein n=1 Tax=Diadema antillarum TaxID=105358 RepID=UPI003A8C4DFD